MLRTFQPKHFMSGFLFVEGSASYPGGRRVDSRVDLGNDCSLAKIVLIHRREILVQLFERKIRVGRMDSRILTRDDEWFLVMS